MLCNPRRHPAADLTLGSALLGCPTFSSVLVYVVADYRLALNVLKLIVQNMPQEQQEHGWRRGRVGSIKMVVVDDYSDWVQGSSKTRAVLMMLSIRWSYCTGAHL